MTRLGLHCAYWIGFGFGLLAGISAEGAVNQEMRQPTTETIQTRELPKDLSDPYFNTGIRVLLGKSPASVDIDFVSAAIELRPSGTRTWPSSHVHCAMHGKNPTRTMQCNLPIDDNSVRFQRQDSGGGFRFGGNSYLGSVVIQARDGEILVINHLPLETYLRGTVGAEMLSQWPIEALKAQAVAARTYALTAIRSRASRTYDVESTVLDQVYAGNKTPASIARAVDSTRGEILTFGAKPIRALYHSRCGGRTEPAEAIWGSRVGMPPQISVACDHCQKHPQPWTATLPVQTLLKMAGLPISPKQRFKISIVSRSPQGRAQRLRLEVANQERILSGEDVRRMVGYTKIQSTNFRWRLQGSRIVFEGTGNGHGSGMCQWGARAMAQAGRTYQQILHHFYPKTVLESLTAPLDNLVAETKTHAKPRATSKSSEWGNWDDEELSLLLRAPGRADRENADEPAGSMQVARGASRNPDPRAPSVFGSRRLPETRRPSGRQ